MRELAGQALRFLGIGGLATVIHVAVAYASAGAGAPPLLANAVGFLCAFAVSYLGNFYWTFGCRDRHAARFPRFIVASGIGFGATNALVLALVDGLGLAFEVALLAIAACVPALNFAVAKLWVYEGRVRVRAGDT